MKYELWLRKFWQNDFVILYDTGEFHKYDGLTGLFVKLVNADNG